MANLIPFGNTESSRSQPELQLRVPIKIEPQDHNETVQSPVNESSLLTKVEPNESSVIQNYITIEIEADSHQGIFEPEKGILNIEYTNIESIKDCNTQQSSPKIEQQYGTLSCGIWIKQELNENDQSNARNNLYEDHEIKEEMVIGPTETSSSGMIPPDLMQTGDLLKEMCFTCEECGQSLSNKHDLRDHMRSHLLKLSKNHEKKKIYSCKLCNLQFNDRSAFTYHNYRHDKRFACDVCEKRFVFKHLLETHKLTHTGEKPFQCKQCLKHFQSKHILTYHAKKNCPGNVDLIKSFSCNICNATFPDRGYLYRHKYTHAENQHVCDFCGMSFFQKWHLVRHMEIHMEKKPVLCDICNKACPTHTQMLQHRKCHKRDNKYSCSSCQLHFRSQKLLKTHNRSHKAPKAIIACGTCNTRFHQLEHLTRHQLVHSGQNPCIWCDATFANWSDLATHEVDHYIDKSNTYFMPYTVSETGKRLFVCKFCNVDFRDGTALQVHMYNHVERRPYSCDICSKQFIRKQSLITHKYTHSDFKPYQCKKCLKRMLSNSSLTYHLKKHCPGFVKVKKEKLETDKGIECEICSKVFETKQKLYSHKYYNHNDHKYTCPVCKKVFAKKRQLSRHRNEHAEVNRFVCDHCLRSYKDKHNLIKHLHVHIHENPFPCPFCSELFTSKTLLTKHLPSHVNETIIPDVTPSTSSTVAPAKHDACKICHETFNTKHELRMHKRKVHQGNELYICDICDKHFKARNGLTRHLMIHRGEKLHTCNICNKSFTQKGHMVSHQMIHTGNRPFVCEICNKQFTRRHYLNKHRQNHFGPDPGRMFVCDLCQKQFKRKASLVDHIYIHMMLDKIKCKHCDRIFPHKNALRQHINSHRPSRFICEYCDKKFYYKSDHDRHALTHIGKASNFCSVCKLKFSSRKLLKNHHCILEVEVHFDQDTVTEILPH